MTVESFQISFEDYLDEDIADDRLVVVANDINLVSQTNHLMETSFEIQLEQRSRLRVGNDIRPVLFVSDSLEKNFKKEIRKMKFKSYIKRTLSMIIITLISFISSFISLACKNTSYKDCTEEPVSCIMKPVVIKETIYIKSDSNNNYYWKINSFIYEKVWKDFPPIRAVSLRYLKKIYARSGSKIWDTFPPIRAVSLISENDLNCPIKRKKIWKESPPIRAVLFHIICSETYIRLFGLQLYICFLCKLKIFIWPTVPASRGKLCAYGDTFAKRRACLLRWRTTFLRSRMPNICYSSATNLQLEYPFGQAFGLRTPAFRHRLSLKLRARLHVGILFSVLKP